MNRFEVAVFGKKGCSKCELLKKRVGKILAEKNFDDFEMVYYDLGTEEGLVRFSQCEVLNIQRIPSFTILHKGPINGRCDIRPVICLKKVSVLDNEKTETFIGIETDYSTNGVIAPKTIRQTLEMVMQNEAVKA
jgi:hypothetical protein